MKTDRFFRSVLVAIAILLFLNLFETGGANAISPAKVEASSPVFFKVGKSYRCFYPSNSEQPLKIIQVDPSSGWVLSDTQFGKFWFNTALFASCME
jgi:hypothetical protein